MNTVRASEDPLDAPELNRNNSALLKGKLTPLRTKAEVQASSETSKYLDKPF
jgi:hypothetical protein